MKHWDWTWEEPHPRRLHKREPLPDAPPTVARRPSHAPLTQFRRRRAGAALGLVAIAVLLIVAISSHGGGHASRVATGHSAARQVAAARLSPAEEQALTNQTQNRALDRVLSYTPVVTAGGSKGNEVALTFDDGPGPYTERLVGVLNSLHVHATFFAVGLEERYFSEGRCSSCAPGTPWAITPRPTR